MRIKTIVIQAKNYELKHKIIETAGSCGTPFLICIASNTGAERDDFEFLRNTFPHAVVVMIPQKAISADVIVEIYAFDCDVPGRLTAENTIVFEHSAGEKYLITAIKTSGREKYTRAFEILDKNLQTGGFFLGDILRQWNYIPHIIGEKEEYSQFNQARKIAYSGKMEVLPAATGIGASGDDFVLVAIAGNCRKYSIENPLQVPVKLYSAKVLTGEKSAVPLFSRALMNDAGNIFISGTAAIRGEESLEPEIIVQTRCMLENVKKLISQENLPTADKTKISHFRVYVKFESDMKKIAEIIKDEFPDVPVSYVVANVCRENLLVEIEGMI